MRNYPSCAGRAERRVQVRESGGPHRWLTGLANRLAWEEHHIDGLKSANDTRGHDFGVRLTGPSGEAAVSRLVEGLKETLARHAGLDGRPLTASVAAASRPPQPTLSAALEHADRGLYVAKRERENRLK